MGRALRFVALGIAATCILAGCASGRLNKNAGKLAAPQEAKKEKPKLLWPDLPDQPRFKFAGILRTASDFVQESDDVLLKRALTGQKANDDRPVIDKPAGIAVRQGLVYVVDRGELDNSDHKIGAFSANGQELFRLGLRGHEQGKFNIPLTAAVANDS